MLRTDYYMTIDNNVELVRTYSDIGRYIIQNETGIKYTEAIDVVPVQYSYTETNERIEVLKTDDNQTIEQLKAAIAERDEALRILGVSV